MNVKELIKIKKISVLLNALLKNRPTWCLLVLFFLLTIYALIIFGVYAVKTPASAELNTQLEIKKDLYQKVLRQLQARDTNIQQGIGQEYPDIFK